MLAIWGGNTYQFDARIGSTARSRCRSSPLSSNGTPSITYPFYRLVVLAAAIVIGIGLWLMLNRTRVGMMIRAGVDDRAMLSASGVNVQCVFAIIFALGAGLAGFAGVVGGTALSIAPGEDVRYLLASLVVVIVGGMGSIPGPPSARCSSASPNRSASPICRLTASSHLRHHGRGAGGAAAGPHGPAAMSAAAAIPRPPQRAAAWADADRHRPIVLARAAHRLSRCVAIRFLHRPDRRIFADPRRDRAVADVARRIWRHGLPRADDRRRRRRLYDRDLRRQQRRRSSASVGRGGSLVPFALPSRSIPAALIGLISVRTAASIRS